jgi:uncharacterized repeat protein (TIGR04076 family)
MFGGNSMAKAKDPGVGRRVVATVTDLKGTCNAGHEIGDQFYLSCHNPDGLCGFFYHDIFPRLSVIQFGGRYPWWTQEQTVFKYECPDKKNLVTLKLEVLKD